MHVLYIKGDLGEEVAINVRPVSRGEIEQAFPRTTWRQIFERFFVFRHAADGERFDAMLVHEGSKIALVEMNNAAGWEPYPVGPLEHDPLGSDFFANAGGEGYQPDPWDGTSTHGVYVVGTATEWKL